MSSYLVHGMGYNFRRKEGGSAVLDESDTEDFEDMRGVTTQRKMKGVRTGVRRISRRRVGKKAYSCFGTELNERLHQNRPAHRWSMRLTLNITWALIGGEVSIHIFLDLGPRNVLISNYVLRHENPR